jgi:hypothetical protein
MKTLIKLTILSVLFASCASNKPPIWRDKYGVIHRENVEPDEIAYVKVVDSAHQIPGGCMRLRNIYLSGTAFKDWELQTETAKQFGTHVLKQYYNGVSDIMGIAYDCKNWRSISSKRKALNLMMRNSAIGELERRSYEKVKITPVKDNIPVLEYDSNK